MALTLWQLADWDLRKRALDAERQSVRNQQAKWTKIVPRAKSALPPLKPLEAARHNAAAAALNVPWSDIFDGLERGSAGDVGLTLVEPDARKGALRMQAESKQLDTLIKYAQRVAADPAFGQFTLHTHETNEQDPNRPARLSFDLQLSPPTLGAPR